MDQVLTNDFFEYGRSGKIYSREDCLAVEQEPIDAILPLTDFKVHSVTNDVVQTTYKSIVTYSGIKQYALRSSIWVKHLDKWKLRFHQGTPLKQI